MSRQPISSEADRDEAQQSPAPVKRRGWRRFFQRGALAFGILGLFLLIVWKQVGRSGQRQLDAIVAQLDAQDPGWRLEEIDIARLQAIPPPGRNSATTVLAIANELSPAWRGHRKTRSWEWAGVTNQRLTDEQSAWFVGFKRAVGGLGDKARINLLKPELLARPGGYYQLIQRENPFLTPIPHIDKVREVVDLLDCDARLAVLDGDPNRGIRAARATLSVGKSIGDEPFSPSQLARIAAQRIAVRSAMQVLAWSEPTEGLAELQAELRSEADFPWMHISLRGERAILNQFFDGLRSGKLTYNDISIVAGTQTGGRFEAAGFRVYHALLAADQAKSLELLTEHIEASKLPCHEQIQAFAQIKMPPRPPDNFHFIITNMIVPSWATFAIENLRGRADLLTASTAIACERYRRAHGRWPDTLADIPRNILPEIPTDPFNGQPIQYRKLDDGVVVFSVGDGDQLMVQRRKNRNDALSDLGTGWQLWNPERRGVPPAAAQPEVKAPRNQR